VFYLLNFYLFIHLFIIILFLFFIFYFFLFNSTTCQSDNDCPYYSIGCQKKANIGVCIFHIQCNKLNGCVALNQEYEDKLYKKSGLFANVNNNAYSKLGNSTYIFDNILGRNQQCISDEECFSKKCSVGMCMPNKKDPIMVCQIVEKRDDRGLLYKIFNEKINGTDALEISCKRGIFEFCEISYDCVTNYCEHYLINACSIKDETILNAILFLISLIFISGFCCFIRLCIKSCKCCCNISYQKKYRKFDQYNPHILHNKNQK